MQGHVAIVIDYGNGKSRIINYANLVLDVARTDLMNIFLGAEDPAVKQFDKIVVANGPGILPPVNSDTALQGTTVRQLSIEDTEILSTFSLRMTSETVTIDSGASPEVFIELGLFRDDRIFSRVVLPSEVNIPAGSQYSIKWTITF